MESHGLKVHHSLELQHTLDFKYHRVTLFILDFAILGSIIKHDALTLYSPF